MRAERAKRSLARFIREAWNVVEPGTPLAWNWHIDAVAEHLEAVTRGQIRKLLINIPPGHMKSLLVSVFWPAWEWLQKPEKRGIFSSYASDLSVRDSVRCRSVIESQWFRQSFEPDWELAGDQNVKSFFVNTKMGFRISLSVTGKGTGFRGDCVTVDDPLNAADAYSKAARDSAIFWWDKTMSSRLNDMRTGSKVIVMQRLHEEDLSGHVLALGGYEHLCLPSEFDPSRRCVTSLGVIDKREAEGEALFPEMFPFEVLKQARVDLGTDGFSGQHQQEPVSAEGGMFHRDWWRFWSDGGQRVRRDGNLVARPRGCSDLPPRPLPEKFDRVVLSLDATFKDAKASDFVCLTKWGFLGADRFLLRRIKERLDFVKTKHLMIVESAIEPIAEKKLVEDKANGPAIISELKSKIPGLVAIEPKGSKEARAYSVQPEVEAGNVYLPDGADWLEDYVGELATFPLSKNDDQVDSTSQALIEAKRRRGIVA